jgi:hypothetical protein
LFAEGVLRQTELQMRELAICTVRIFTTSNVSDVYSRGDTSNQPSWNDFEDFVPLVKKLKGVPGRLRERILGYGED